MQLCFASTPCGFVLQHGETAVHMAASGGHVDVLKFLQDKGVNINIKDKVSLITLTLKQFAITCSSIIRPENEKTCFLTSFLHLEAISNV